MICSNETIYAVLSAFVKFVNYNPNLRSIVIPILEGYFESWDTELQQRATEYYILCKLDNEDPNLPNISEIRSKLLDTLPAFPKEIKANSMLNKRLEKNKIGDIVKKSGNDSDNKNNSNDNSIFDDKDKNDKKHSALNAQNIDKIGEMMSNTKIEGNPYSDHIIFEKNPNGFAFIMNKYPEEANPIDKNLLNNNFNLFKSVLTNSAGGVIFNDPDGNYSIDIKIKPPEKGLLMAMMTFITNTGRLEDIEIHPVSASNKIKLNISKVKYPNDDKSFPQVMLKMQLMDSFIEPIQLGFKARIGSMKIENLFALPIMLNKFIEQTSNVSVENFTAQWYEISNSPDKKYHKFDSILFNPMENSPIQAFLKKFAALLNTLNFKIYPPSDLNNFHEIEGISILELENISIPILVQASFVPSHPSEFRFSLRCKMNDEESYYYLLCDIYSLIKFFLYKN